MLIVTRDFQSELLDALGIPYLEARLGERKTLFLTSEMAAQQLADLVKEEIITGDNAREAQSFVDEARLFENYDQVRAAIEDFDLEDRPWEFDFSECSCGEPFVHGYIEAHGERVGAPPVTDLYEGVALTLSAIVHGRFDTPTGIHLLKGMIEIDLPNDETDAQARIDALPAEVREELMRRQQEPANPIEALMQMLGGGLGGGGMTVLELGPDGLQEIDLGGRPKG